MKPSIALGIALVMGPLLGAHHAGEAEHAGPQPITTCEAEGNARPLCGFQDPEDLAPLPGGGHVLVSEYGAMQGGKSGRLALLDLRNDGRRVLWNGGDASGTDESWGDAACPGPPDASFSPHGIDVETRADGRLQLLVVQHGGRESVEFFEVEREGRSWKLTWRGCAVAPENSWLNEVVHVPGGGFLTTSMVTKGELGDLQEAFAGGAEPSGRVWEWQRDGGWSEVPGTLSALPNGIEVSADGAKVFLNVSGAQEVWRIDRASGTVEARAPIGGGGDNSTWAPDGRLLVASLRIESHDFEVCMSLPRKAACPLGFAIVALNPDTMETEDIYANAGPPMGGGTVGLQIGNELLIGSAFGDRILRVTLDAAQ